MNVSAIWAKGICRIYEYNLGHSVIPAEAGIQSGEAISFGEKTPFLLLSVYDPGALNVSITIIKYFFTGLSSRGPERGMMMNFTRAGKRWGGFCFLFLFLIWVPGAGFCGEKLKPGGDLSGLVLPAPVSDTERGYLGVGDRDPFAVKDAAAKVIVLEILGVYCPQCHKQRPHINRLFHRVNKDPNLSKKVKFLGVAAGASAMEAAYYSKQAKVPYPVLPDEKFAIHKHLGEPRTPFNMVVSAEGRILYAHLGIIKDMNAFFSTLKELADK